MSEEVFSKPGIYQHYKTKNLYFVLGDSYLHDLPSTLPCCHVTYYPLYPHDKQRWERRSVNEFFEVLNIPELTYYGLRFTKIFDWETPNILPGKIIKTARSRTVVVCGGGERYYGSGIFTIVRLFLDEKNEIQVELTNSDGVDEIRPLRIVVGQFDLI